MYKQLVHIGTDSMFIDYTIDQFEQIVPGKSDYLIDVDNLNDEIKNIKNKQKVSPYILRDDEKKKLLIKRIASKIVILHSLNTNMIELVNMSGPDIKFVWLVWGAEIYSLPILRRTVYQKKTLGLLRKSNGFKVHHLIYERMPNFFYVLYKIKNGKPHPDIQKIKAFKRIDYCGIFLKQDFQKYISCYDFRFKNIWYCYYNIEDTVLAIEENTIKGRNILVGNSSNPSNNHLDIFEKLSKLNLAGKKIICPLSYGASSDDYVDIVLRSGNKLFGDSFFPLMDFMTKEKYNSIVQSCDIVIMNHIRQQAFGNILTSLYLGAKVFLNEISPLYQFFKENGVKVFSIDYQLKNAELKTDLPGFIIERNKDLLYGMFSRKQNLLMTEKFINCISK